MELLLGARARVALLIVVAAVVQAPVIDRFSFERSHPDLLLLLPVLAGLLGGPEDGAWVGFFSGLVADTALPTAFGFAGLVYCLTGFLVGAIAQALLEGPWWVVPATAGVGTAIGAGLFVGVGFLTGQDVVSHAPEVVGRSVAVISAGNAVLAFPVALAVRWAIGPDERRAARG